MVAQTTMNRPTNQLHQPVGEMPETGLLQEELALPGDFERKFRGVQIASVQKYTPIMMMGNVVNSGLFFWVAVQAELAAIALPWLVLILLYSLKAVLSWRRSRRRVATGGASERAAQRAVVNALLLGTAWGLAAVMLYPAADAQGQTVVAVITGGMIYGGGFALATMPVAMNAYLVPLVLCAFGALALSQQPINLILGILLLVFSFIIQRAGASLGRLLRTNFEDREQIAEQSKVIGLLLHDFERNASDWFWQIDADGRLKRGLEQIAEATLTPVELLRDSDFRELTTQCCSDPGCHSALFQRQLSNGRPFRGIEIHFYRTEDSRWLRLSGHPLHDAAGSLVGYRGVASNISAEKAAEKRIAYLARHDSLTGLLNRSSFGEELERFFMAHRAMSEAVCLLYLDLDGFKGVNDRRGHVLGDCLLADVSRRISDVTGGAGVVARIGGDEFAVLMQGVEREAALNLASRLIHAIGEPVILDGGQVRIGVSIGVAFAGPDADTPEKLVSAADIALYSAKESGKNVSHVFDARMRVRATRQHELQQDLHFAIERNELDLLYQPIVLAKSGQIQGFEALLRWRHPVRGMLLPDEFIHLAEAGGTIHDIGSWVAREACHTAATWPTHMFVSINLSPEQFQSSDLEAEIDGAIRGSGLDPRRLWAELTENVLIEDAVLVAENISAMKALGITVALDDFGTGYAGFGYLTDLGIDTLKIDRSLVMNCDTDERAQKVLEAIMVMGRALGLKMTAEGIENSQQALVLRNLGCDHLQGYFFGRPLSHNQVQERLQTWTCDTK